jgi:hypothetical protein
LLKEKLLIELQTTCIFCLQEVCLFWLSKLIPFFQSFGYICHYNNYGFKDTGHMGVLIAYPNQYTLEEIKILHIGDNIKNRVIVTDPVYEKDDIWTKAIRKKNTLLCLKLRADRLVFL